MKGGFGTSRNALACVLTALGLHLFPLAGEAAAQAGGTASIIGQVTDESKALLPGVTVTATSPALQVPNVVTITDERGEYRLTPLPIGTYNVEYSLQGFQTVRREGVKLTAGFTAKLDIVLGVGQLEESVTVSGASPVVDTAATSITTHVTAEVLENIPTSRNGYTGLLELAPGVRGNIDVGGSTNNGTPSFSNFGMQEESWQAVEGMSTKTPNISDSGNFPDFSTIEQAAIETMGHDASVPSRGVAINTVVKSGGNQYHGMAFYGGTTDALESDPASGGSLKYRDDFIAQLGGPLMQNKVWFFVGYRYQRQERYVINCFKPDGEQCVRDNKSPFLTPKVTYQLSPSQKLIGMAWMNERIDTAIADGGLIQWSNRRNWGGFDGVVKGEWQGLRGNTLVLNVLGGLFWNHSGTKCVDETCTMIYRRDRNTGVISGLTNRAGERNVEERRQIRGSLSWYRPNWIGGNHEIKAGADYFHTPANRSLADRGAAQNYLLNFRSGAADRIEIFNAPVSPDNAGQYVGLFLADTWTIGRKLTLNLGVRYAYDSAYENEGCREAAPPPAHLAFPATCWEKTQMPIFRSLVPRLRAAYDITGDGKTVVKGGWGRYVRMRLFDHLQPMARNVISTAVYRWRDLNRNLDYDTGEVNLNPNSSDFLSLTLTGTFTSGARGVVNPDEQQPYTDEYSLQFERQLFPELAVRVTGIHARVSDVIRLANRARPYEVYSIPIRSADPGPDGRVGSGDDTGNVITWYDYPKELAGVAFQQVTYVNDARANEHYSAVETAVSKRLSNNWQLQASYTATKKHIPLTPNEDTFNTQDPNAEIFAADNTWEWLARVSGSYLFPYGIVASARFEHRSGMPWARTAILDGGTQIPNITVRVEPLGSQRLPNINLLSLRGEKRFGLPRGQQVHLRMNLHNLTNTTVPTSVNTLSGSTYGVLTGQVLPRIVNFEVEYKF
jgi:hypothetical protein